MNRKLLMNEFTTSDLGLAAFMFMRGLKLISAKKLTNGRFEFILNDEDSSAQALSIEYVSSEFCQFVRILIVAAISEVVMPVPECCTYKVSLSPALNDSEVIGASAPKLPVPLTTASNILLVPEPFL